MSENSETVHESTQARGRQAIASYFRRLARRLSGGEPVPADEAQTVTVDPPDVPELGVEVEREAGQLHLAIDIAWEEREDDLDTDATASKATFEVYEDRAGEWRWRLVHDNGNVIADDGEGYASKQKATQGIESVRSNAPGAHVLDSTKAETVDAADDSGSDATFEVYEDRADEWRWRLVHDNGNVIADGGQGYASKQKARQGLRSVQTNVPGAPVEDVT